MTGDQECAKMAMFKVR